MRKCEKILEFAGGKYDRFFTQHMNAVLETEGDLFVMHMIRRRNIYRIDTVLQKDVFHTPDGADAVLQCIITYAFRMP